MPLTPDQQDSEPRFARLRRHRSVLLGSVFALALGGAVAGELVVAAPSPAIAQTTTSQPMPEQARMMSFADLVQKVKPAVVSVRVKTAEDDTQQMSQVMPFFFRQLPPDHPLRRFFGNQIPGQGNNNNNNNNNNDHPRRHFGMAQGSGFFISADGYIVTNNHVVEKATDVEVITDAGKSLPAKVVGTDPRTDLALLKVTDGGQPFPFVDFSNQVPRVGDWVIAIGNPFGLGGSVTAGIVSARGRDVGSGPYADFLQIDAPVNHGNSGGPTFDLNGHVVGINTAIYSPSGGSVGIAFDVPSEVAIGVIQQLKEHGTVTRGYLGVQIQPVTKDIADSIGLKEAKGAMVVDAQPGTPAEKAGIKAGDVIVGLNGKTVDDARDLSRRVAALAPGDEAHFTVWRDNAQRQFDVKLTTMPAQDKLASLNQGQDHGDNNAAPSSLLSGLGLELQPAHDVPGAGDDGVVVTDVDQDSAAAQKLSTGDVILEAGGRKVASPQDVAGAIEQARKRGSHSILMRVQTSGHPHYVALTVTAKPNSNNG
jgi:serine protease Do